MYADVPVFNAARDHLVVLRRACHASTYRTNESTNVLNTSSGKVLGFVKSITRFCSSQNEFINVFCAPQAKILEAKALPLSFLRRFQPAAGGNFWDLRPLNHIFT